MTSWLAVFGRLHPLLLHLPIGLLAGLALLELLVLVRRLHYPDVRGLQLPLVWTTAAAGVLSALTGYVLSREPGYGGDLLTEHRWLGIGVAAGAVLTAVLLQWGRPLWARLALLATLCVLLPAGHHGASITHGEGFLTEPMRERPASAVPALASAGQEAPARASYASHVAPFLESTCTACHGPAKRKGRLALHTREAIEAGGFDGPVLVAGQPDASELVRRLRLPLEDEDHMPPKDKRQPSPAEIDLIERWIAAGASFEDEFEIAQALPPAPSEPSPTAPPEPPAAPATAPEQALAALRERLVHVQPLEEGSPLLWIDFAAPATSLTDEVAARLLEPVAAHAAELSLARVPVGTQTLHVLARMPELRRLDLRAAGIDDAGLALLRGLPKLEHLVLVQNRLGDASADTLLALPALAQAYLWSSGMSAEAIARLRAARPELAIDAGDTPPAASVEAESEIALSSDAPLPGQENLAPALTPINGSCPVSGSPVNPKFSVVFEGRVVGFCCPNCPKEFWSNPDQFRAKLP